MGPFRADVNLELTQRWYAQAEEWGCDCGDCRNFLKLAHERALPAPVLEMLDKLGVPPGKATYVCEMYPTEDGHCYEFSYRLAGHILSGEERGFGSWGGGSVLFGHECYPYGAPDFPKPHFDLDFLMPLPWVLEEATN